MTRLNKLLTKISNIGISLYFCYIFCVLFSRIFTGSSVTETDFTLFVLFGMIVGIVSMLRFALKPSATHRRKKALSHVHSTR